MEKMQIYQDKNAIETDLERASDVCGVLHELYSKLKKGGHKPTYQVVEDIAKEVIYHASRSTLDEYDMAAEFLKTLILKNNKENTQVMGFSLNDDKLKEMMELDPDEVASLAETFQKFEPQATHFFELIDLNPKNNKVELTNEAEETITNRHTIYAETEKQIEVAQTMIDLCNQLNIYQKVCSGANAGGAIEGLTQKLDKTWSIDPKYIKRF